MKTRRMLLNEAKGDDNQDKKKKETKPSKSKKATNKPIKSLQKKRYQSESESSPEPPSRKNKNKRQVSKQQKKQQLKKKVKKETPEKKDKVKNNGGKKKQSPIKTKQSSQSKSKKIKKDKSPQKKMKTVQMTGSVPVDQYFPIKGNYHVLQHQGKTYAATLNQTKVMTNNNKFYILQILEDQRRNSYYFWTRWARVGKVGQNSNVACRTKQMAIKLYEDKLYDKNVKGQYKFLQLNYNASDSEDEKKKKKNNKNVDGNGNGVEDAPVIKERVKDFTQSKLPQQLKNLIKLMFDTDMMNRQMKQIGYDASRMPLGKLSKDTILKGYQALKSLMQQVNKKKPNQKIIQQLNNTFYSFIPHDFGFSNMAHHILRTQAKVKQKLQMLQSLQNITVARKLIKSNEQDVNIIDQNYAKLDRDIQVLTRTSREYEIVEQYLNNTHASTHSSYSLEIESIFKMHKKNEQDRYTQEIGNKMLLWHGSRLTNYVGILSQGLRIAPPQAPVTGYMFGKGVYFADMVSKSANYCFTNPTNNTGLLLLCQVACGGMNQKFQSDYYADLLPPGKNSTKGVGKTAPPLDSYIDLNGYQVPLGQGKTQNIQTSLLYNEYIVYNINQIKLKYLLRVKFNYKNRR